VINNTLLAQNVITGIVQDEAGTPIPYANVILLHPNDSIKQVRGALANEEGRYQFEKVIAKDYRVLSFMMGYNKVYSEVFHINSSEHLELPSIKLSESVLRVLDDFEFIGEKLPYQQEIDGLRINVANSIVSAGATALEVLERSPGVIVDRQNNNISLAGKEGVNVMINGKLTYMPIGSLVQFLDGMNADNISSIKLMTTPPAKYDAEGTGGYIDIQLKKRTDEGLNGSFSLSYGYGRGHNSNNNLNLNYRKNKLNLFGSYAFVYRAQEQLFKTNRRLLLGNQEERSTTTNERDPIQRNHNIRFGLDYEISDKTVFGALISAYDNQWTMDALNTNRMFLNEKLSNVLLSDNQERNSWQNLSTNLNLKHNLSKKEWVSVDVDYLTFYNENPTDYTNRLLDAEEQFLEESLIRSGKVTPLNVLVGKIDYYKQLNDKFRLELGAKAVNSTFENDVTVETLEGSNWVQDPFLTSSSELSEQILAGYASSDWKISASTNAKVGLRYEYSDSKLDTDTEGRVVDRQFGKLFPSVFLSHQFSEQLGSNISYSRRITRPTFREMVPFVYFLDPNTFFAGNTALQPALTDAVKLNLNYKSVFFSMEYSVQDSAIARFQQRFDPVTERLVLASENLKNTKTLSFTLGFPIQITNWWNMRTNAIYYRQENNGYLDGDLTQIKQNYFQFNTNQSFKLPMDFSSELSFFYIGPRLSGTLRFGEMYGLNLGIQKKLGEKGGVLRFNVRDMLNSVVLRGNADVPSQNFAFNGNFDFSQRTFSLSYSRSFGNNKVKAARKRQTGAAEEQKRAN